MNDLSEAVVGDGDIVEWLEMDVLKESSIGDGTEVLGVLGGENVVRMGYEIIAAGLRRLKGLNLPRSRREGERKALVNYKS